MSASDHRCDRIHLGMNIVGSKSVLDVAAREKLIGGGKKRRSHSRFPEEVRMLANSPCLPRELGPVDVTQIKSPPDFRCCARVDPGAARLSFSTLPAHSRSAQSLHRDRPSEAAAWSKRTVPRSRNSTSVFRR